MASGNQAGKRPSRSAEMSRADASAESTGHDAMPLIATLGMFIVDSFRFEDPESGANLGDGGRGEEIGGGGTYFAIGARVWLKPKEILMTVDRGKDLAPAMEERMSAFARSSPETPTNGLWRWRRRRDGVTTRALNIYRGDRRGFAYLTPKMRLDPVDLVDGGGSLPRFVHCICSPERASVICDQIDELVSLGRGCGRSGKCRPFIVWEPIPESARPENLAECFRVMARISVISPNHEEAAAFLSVPLQDVEMQGSESTAPSAQARHRDKVRNTILQRLLLDGFVAGGPAGRQAPIICIRCGALGAVVAAPGGTPHFVDAWHEPSQVSRVVDVTGAGNAFLGGLCASLSKLPCDDDDDDGDDDDGARVPKSWTSASAIVEAVEHGAVSASFVVEQQGLPTLTWRGHDGVELWNGDEPALRLARLRDRHSQSQG